ncbi:MAG: hypothetical protein OEV31_01355 [Gammaproteobacteria bacterium]|nr:hypothetical protein [Gammaproteobacteria bacterium]
MNNLYNISTNITLNDSEAFSPDDYLVGVLRSVIERGRDVAIELQGEGKILVRPLQGDFFADAAHNISAFCAARAERYRIHSLSPIESKQLAARRPGQNIDELMWTAGFFASRGRLIEGAHFNVVRLRHWPNLTRLPRTPNTMRIVALLTRYPTSLVVAQRLLKIEMSEINWVYSAAHCAGLIQVVNGASDTTHLVAHRHQSLLKQLLGKIIQL